MQFCKRLIFTAVLVFSGAGITPADSAVISYTATGVASGSIGSAGFSGPVSMTAVADTATKQACMSPTGPIANCSIVLNSSLKVEISDIGVISFLNPTYSFLNYNIGVFGFGEIFSASPLALRQIMSVNFSAPGLVPNADLKSYDLISSFGPVSTTSVVARSIAPGTASVVPFITDFGPMFTNGSPPVAATFAAKLEASAVPEPTSWLMMVLGFGLVGLVVRSKSKSQPECDLHWSSGHVGGRHSVEVATNFA